MSERVREIPGWYGSDNPGTLTNLARILNHGKLRGTGRIVILPVDQGFEHCTARSFATNPPAYDPRYHFQLAIESGRSACAAPLGFLEAGAREFAGRIRAGKLVHRRVSTQRAAVPRRAINNYRMATKLLRDREVETERLIDAKQKSRD